VEHLKVEVVSIPQGWNWHLAPENITVSPGGSANTTLSIARYSYTAGEYTITLRFQHSDGHVDFDLTLRVADRYYGFEVYPLSDPSQTAGPNSTVTFSLRIKNTEEAVNVIAVQYLGLPEEWSAEVRDDSGSSASELSLGPLEERTVSLFIHIPEEVEHYSATVTLYILSLNNTSRKDSINITVTVKGPDLRIEAVKLPSNIYEGSRAVVNVVVANTGSASADRFEVALYIDGRYFKSKTVAHLASGENMSVKFTWVPEPGTHTIRAEVNTNRTVKELDYTNNMMEVTARVPASNEELGMLLIISAVIGAVVITVAYHKYQTSHREEKVKKKSRKKRSAKRRR